MKCRAQIVSGLRRRQPYRPNAWALITAIVIRPRPFPAVLMVNTGASNAANSAAKTTTDALICSLDDPRWTT